MHFYTVIIGTEILNARREDKHFKFVQEELQKYGHEMFVSLIIKDDRDLIVNCYEMIKKDPQGVMFSFGGIGSTPDDLTREIASEVFCASALVRHKKFEQDIIEKFGENAYPHRIHMSDLPPHADLLFNPVNNMSGFSLQNRYFFVPGFPQMAHPMIRDAIEKHFSHAVKKYRFTLLADTSENYLIHIMQRIPSSIELSSLPMFKDAKPMVEISLIGENEQEVQSYFGLFVEELETKHINYKLI